VGNNIFLHMLSALFLTLLFAFQRWAFSDTLGLSCRDRSKFVQVVETPAQQVRLAASTPSAPALSCYIIRSARLPTNCTFSRFSHLHIDSVQRSATIWIWIRY